MLSTSFTSAYSRDQLKRDSAIIIFILILPVLLYLHNFIPEIKTLETQYFKFDSGFYSDIRVWVYYVGLKATFVLSFITWYVTCKHWWRFILYIPIIYFCIQLYFAINSGLMELDEGDFFVGLIFSIPIILLTYCISKKFKYYSKVKTLNDQIDTEIEGFISKVSCYQEDNIKEIKHKFTELKKNKLSMDNKEYLMKLIELKENLV